MPNMTVNQQRDREDDYKYQGAAGSPNYDQAYHQQQTRAESVYTANAALPRGKSDTEADQRLRDVSVHFEKPARTPLDGRNDQRRVEQERDEHDEREDREYQERVRRRALPAETRRELEMLDELDRLKAEGPARYRTS
ncbi:hypothetical protein N0V95_007699 [Ascochyta clinopodiicola]|nr:hypothetical protein N0V95_007699 [Ascochyta clinopodiicola]